MRKKIIIANWKMNPRSLKEASSLVRDTSFSFKNNKKSEIVFCPPFIYLESLSQLGKGSKFGSQNVSSLKDLGSFTGEISALMLKNLGIKYSIVGHSERRTLGESNSDINQKVKNLINYNIIPILCVGESERDSDHKYLDFIKTEIEEGLKGINKLNLKDIIIAYEPVWAIGKEAKREATREEFGEILIFIKKILSDNFGVENARKTRIIYGGSVNTKNASSFLEEGSDGFLVGRASLDKKKFNEIIEKVNNSF